MPFYIDKTVEDHEHELNVLKLKENFLHTKLNDEKDIKKREDIQSEIINLSKQIEELNKVIAKYYPNNLNDKLFNS